MKEIFKIIPGFSDYQISNYGRIKSLLYNKELILKPSINGSGHYSVCLSKNGIIITQQIAYWLLLTFVESCPKGKEVSHLNGNPLDNRLENLKWETHKENMYRKIKLTEKNVIQIRKLLKQGFTQTKIAMKFNVSQSTIYRIKDNITWTHIQK